MIEVTAAIIRQNNRVLICQRPENKGNALLWEFPGGKLEPEETLQECLARECREELDIQIKVGSCVGDSSYAYRDGTVHVTFFRAEITGGTITQKEHHAIRWEKPGRLLEYTFCPADTKIVEQISHEFE